MRGRLTAWLVLVLATAASAQTTTTFTDRLVLADPPAKTSETACLWRDASTGMVATGACPTGTVTSVGLSLPGIFSVSGSPVTTSGTLTASLVSQTQNLVWASPNGSSGAPTFRSLVDADIPDNLTLGTVSGNPAFSGYIASSLLPNTTDTYDLGSGARLWNQAFISQLNAVVFAEATTTLFGGYSIIGYNAGALAADVSSAATTVNFGKAMTPGHWVLIRAHDTGGTVKAEYLSVGSNVSGTTYNVTRDLAAAHGTDPAWASGTPFLVLGADGTGRVELSAYSTPTGTSPGARVSIITQGATYGALTERVRLGILDGMPGMASGKYGIYIGDTGTQGLSYYDGALTVKGTVTATAGTIGGWTLGATALTAGSGSTTVGLDSGGSNPALYAGSATPGSAPFRVTNAGALTATNATVTGTVNFGGGAGVLDANGLRVSSYTVTDAWNTLNAVSFAGPTNSTGRMGMSGYEGTDHAVKALRLEAINTRADATNNSAQVRLTAGGTNDGNTYYESSIVIEGSDATNSDIIIDPGNALYVSGGLRVSSTGTVANELYSGGAEVTFNIGRNSNEHLNIRVTDQGVILESVQDEDSGDYGEMIYRADGDGTANGFHHFQKKDGSYASVLMGGLNLRNWVDSAGNRYVCTDAGTGSTGWLYKSNATCAISSRRYKQDIAPLPLDGVDRVLDLVPVTFRYTAEAGGGPPMVGAIAEDAADLGLEWLIERDAQGRPERFIYDKVALYLLPLVKAQRERLAALEARVSALEPTGGQNR